MCQVLHRVTKKKLAIGCILNVIKKKQDESKDDLNESKIYMYKAQDIVGLLKANVEDVAVTTVFLIF